MAPSAKKRSSPRPPVVLNGCRVLAYATVKSPVAFTGRTYLLQDRVELRAVPKLVVAEPLRTPGVFLFHCDDSWSPIAVAGFRTIRDAKRGAEKNYPGISALWRRFATTRAEALRYERKLWAEEACTFCDRIPPEFESCIASKDGRAVICDVCVRRFAVQLRENGG